MMTSADACRRSAAQTSGPPRSKDPPCLRQAGATARRTAAATGRRIVADDRRLERVAAPGDRADPLGPEPDRYSPGAVETGVASRPLATGVNANSGASVASDAVANGRRASCLSSQRPMSRNARVPGLSPTVWTSPSNSSAAPLGADRLQQRRSSRRTARRASRLRARSPGSCAAPAGAPTARPAPAQKLSSAEIRVAPLPPAVRTPPAPRNARSAARSDGRRSGPTACR